MAHNNQQTQLPLPSNGPDFHAWNVTQKSDKSFWNKVGAAWMHKDNSGFTIQLDVVPINGQVVLRKPMQAPDA